MFQIITVLKSICIFYILNYIFKHNVRTVLIHVNKNKKIHTMYTVIILYFIYTDIVILKLFASFINMKNFKLKMAKEFTWHHCAAHISLLFKSGEVKI